MHEQGSMQAIYTFLSLIHNLIIVTLEEEEEDEALAMQHKLEEELKQKEREKERELQERQLMNDPTALPVGNVRDLLKKKKKNIEIINNEHDVEYPASSAKKVTQEAKKQVKKTPPKKSQNQI